MSNPDSGLPSYSVVVAARRARTELKQNFVKLTNDQLDIQELFRTVSNELESTPQIGERHPLCDEWNKLRQRHRKNYRDSQQNAGLCAHFLKNFSEILVPLSQSSDVSVEQKTVMIGRFLEIIPVHMNAAKANAEHFNELAKDVELFPRKVASALRIRADSDSSGFFVALWSGVEGLCMSIWRTLNRLLTKMIYQFKAAVGRLQLLRFSCYISVDVQLRQYQPLPCQSEMSDGHPPMSLKEVAMEARDNCETLCEKLTAFESAWHVVHLACSRLSSDLTMAKSFIACDPAIPQACDSHLQAAGLLYNPLVECLNAYAVGKPPAAFV